MATAAPPARLWLFETEKLLFDMAVKAWQVLLQQPVEAKHATAEDSGQQQMQQQQQQQQIQQQQQHLELLQCSFGQF